MTPGAVDLVDLPGGTLRMGSTDHYQEEAPVVEVEIAPFRLGHHPVTNAEFSAFVDATGYVTVAERPLDGPEWNHLDPDERVPGSLVFTPTSGPVPLDDFRQWWRWLPGASWRLPQGPDSRTRPRADHPVVHVAQEDAASYAAWAGGRLPSEAEHEWASRGGLVGATYAWGEELHPEGRLMANTFQGDFPYRNRGANGFKGTSPVGRFGANPYGLVDLIGNVWEWTSTPWTPDHSGTGTGQTPASPCCGGAQPVPGQLGFVLKGGSHLCNPAYCLRYRPAARSPQSPDSATTHLGFRVAADG